MLAREAKILGLAFMVFLMLVNGLYNSVIWDLAEGHLLAILLGALCAINSDEAGDGRVFTK